MQPQDDLGPVPAKYCCQYSLRTAVFICKLALAPAITLQCSVVVRSQLWKCILLPAVLSIRLWCLGRQHGNTLPQLWACSVYQEHCNTDMGVHLLLSNCKLCEYTLAPTAYCKHQHQLSLPTGHICNVYIYIGLGACSQLAWHASVVLGTLERCLPLDAY